MTKDKRARKDEKSIRAIMTFTMLLLAGCSAVDAKLEQALLEKSGILEQEDYLQYQQYQEKGCLDEDGQYFDPDLDVITSNEQEKPSGKIHITFAENRYMNIRYYAASSMAGIPMPVVLRD